MFDTKPVPETIIRAFDTQPTIVGDTANWVFRSLGTVELPPGRWTLGCRPEAIGPAQHHLFPDIIATYRVGGGKVSLNGLCDFSTYDAVTAVEFFQQTRSGDPDANGAEVPALELAPADLVEPQNFGPTYVGSALRPLGCNWVSLWALDTADPDALVKLRFMRGTAELDAQTQLVQGQLYTFPMPPKATSLRTIGDSQKIFATFFKRVG